MRANALLVMVIWAGFGLAAPAFGAEPASAMLTLSRLEAGRIAATATLQADGKTVVRVLAERRSETSRDRCPALDLESLARLPVRPSLDPNDQLVERGDPLGGYTVAFNARIAGHPVLATVYGADSSSIGQWAAKRFADLALCLDGRPEPSKPVEPDRITDRATLVLLWSPSLAVSQGELSASNGVLLTSDRETVIRGLWPSIGYGELPKPVRATLAQCPAFAGKVSEFRDRVRDFGSLAFVPDLSPTAPPPSAIAERLRYRVSFDAALGDQPGRVVIETQDASGPFVSWAKSAILSGEACVRMKGAK